MLLITFKKEELIQVSFKAAISTIKLDKIINNEKVFLKIDDEPKEISYNESLNLRINGKKYSIYLNKTTNTSCVLSFNASREIVIIRSKD